MKSLIAAAVCVLLAAAPAYGQGKGSGEGKQAGPAKSEQKKGAKREPTEKQKAQQARMKDCSSQAGEKKLKGDERKKFMSSCMKG